MPGFLPTQPTRVLADVDEAATEIDKVARLFEQGVLTPIEALDKLGDLVQCFLSWTPAVTADIDLLIDYARMAAAEVADAPGVHDAVLVELFEEWLTAMPPTDLIRAQLQILVEPLEIAASRGDHLAVDALVEMCRTGTNTHRFVMSLRDARREVLRTAHRIGSAEALRVAVSPRHARDGQIANRKDDPDTYSMAMDLLAHLAADATEGSAARAALLELADFVETAGEAAIRLPLHLLDGNDRARLLSIHEARVELFTSDPVQLPVGLDVLRNNRVVRTAVWQAFDAKHLT